MLKYKERRLPGFIFDRVVEYTYFSILGKKIPVVTNYGIKLNPRWKAVLLIPIVALALLGMAITEMVTRDETK